MKREFILRRLHHTPKLVLLTATFAILLVLFSASAVPVRADPDAVNTWGNGKLYFFRNICCDIYQDYARYDIATYQIDSGYPKVLDSSTWTNWPSSWVDWTVQVTAAVNWGNGKAYFFAFLPNDSLYDDLHWEYLRVDIGTYTVDAGYPQLLDNAHWSGMPTLPTTGFDSGFNMGNGKAYFFRGDQVTRMNIATYSVDWVKGINEVFPNLPSGVTAAANWGSGKLYAFYGDTYSGKNYVRYDIESEQVDAGYPKGIANFASNWPSSWLWGGPGNLGYPIQGGVNWGTGGYPLYSSTSNVVSNRNPSKYGENVTFTAHVTHSSGSATLLGTVTFLSDDQAIFGCIHVPLNSGIATCTYSNLPVGTHTIKVNYSGDANYMISSDTVNGGQVVNKVDTTTTVMGGPNPSRFGQPVTFDAYITPTTGSAYPQGTVTFYDGTTIIPGCGSSSLLYGGIAYCTTGGLKVGSHSINTYYGGNSNFNSSLGMFSPNQVVNAVLYLPLIKR